MNNENKTREDLITELENLQSSYDQLKEKHNEDISLLKLADERFSKSEEKFRKAFLTNPDSVNISRLSDGVIQSVNPGFLNMTGYPESEVIGRTSLEINIWANHDDRKTLVNKLLENGAIENFEADFRKKDGTIIKGSMSASSFDIDGVPHILGVTRDITGQKQVEEKLFLLANALKSINDCVSITDMNDRILFLNEAFLDTYGFTADDLEKEPISLIRSQNNPPEIVSQILPSTLKGGWQGELLNLRKDGSEFPVLLSSSVVKDKDDQPIALIGIAKDITENKRKEDALKNSEERFRSVTESASDAIITTDSTENIIGWNNSAERIFGYGEQEIKGQSLDIIIHPDYHILKNKVIKLLKKGGVKYMTGKTVELNGLKKDGSVFPVELSFSEWKTSEGQYFTGILHDITDRRRTELENNINYEIIRGITITSNLDELLSLVHLSLGKVVYAENFFIALHNNKTGLFSFPYFKDLFDQVPAPASMEKSCTAYVFKTGKPLLLSERLFKDLLDQNEVELVGSKSPSWIGIPLMSSSTVIGVMVLQHYEKENVYSERDIKFLNSVGHQIAISIERKRAEEEIILKNELLLAINAEKDKFFSILAHDLRGPMSAFVAATQILTEDIQNMTLEEIREITIVMKTDATNIYKLLENLLEWSRLKRGVLDFKPVNLNLQSVVFSATESVKTYAAKKQILIEDSLSGDIEILADKHMLETIIRNLVSNSVKFTPSGGKVSISASRGQNNVEIRISDTGIGMTQELMSKLFLLNEKTNRNGTDGEPSTGLGLLLCKEFVEKHSGKIRLESEVNKGTDFIFTIPV